MATPKKKNPKKAGRKTAYRKAYDLQAKKLCILGAIDKDLADFFCVSEKTINTWKEKHPTFLQSLKEGKKEADAKVVRSLYQRATGYSHPETKIATYEGVITDSKEFTKHYPPDTTAIIFWLKNRQPDMWRDKQDLDINNAEQIIQRIKEGADALIKKHSRNPNND